MSGYQLGDVVQLKSGGPAMTVVGFAGPGDAQIECQWFTLEMKPAKAIFPEAALVHPDAAAEVANRLARHLSR
jgi:uncharacterized protein YodC (DUF2158 family)